MKVITTDEVRAALQRALEKRGEDFVLGEGTCYYEINVEGEIHRCLVGEVLADLLDRRDFVAATQQGVNNTQIFSTIAKELQRHCGVAFESKVLVDALQYAQQKQDAGQTWGEAVAAFELVLDRDGVPV